MDLLEFVVSFIRIVCAGILTPGTCSRNHHMYLQSALIQLVFLLLLTVEDSCIKIVELWQTLLAPRFGSEHATFPLQASHKITPMNNPILNEQRVAILKALAEEDASAPSASLLESQFQESNGNVEKALSALEQSRPADAQSISHARFLNSLVDADSIRKIALHFSKNALQSLVQKTQQPQKPSTFKSAAQPEEKSLEIGEEVGPNVTQLRRNLFAAEPTAVVHRMILDNETSLPNETNQHICDILDENPSFNIRSEPVSEILASSKVFKSLADEQKPAVESDFKTLQRVQTMAPVPDAIPTMLNNNLTTSLQISSIPEDSFVAGFSSTFGDPVVARAYTTIRGSGLRVIDGISDKETVDDRITTFKNVVNTAKTQVDLERLFGSIDYCECSDCNSVYSPASYFVELMEFLRHSNLRTGNPRIGSSKLEGTQLEQLLLRRPDLQCIQLTCENTNTLIPYIDLALEVMESYIVYAPTIKAYNVNGETSAELLAEPHHTNAEAYVVLREAVYPLSLPYHLPIDTLRVLLSFLKTSRAELLHLFQPNFVADSGSAQSNEESSRAYDAEQFDHPGGQQGGCGQGCQCSSCSRSRSKYEQQIRLHKSWEYFGYETKAELLDDSPKPKKGLTWVKAQFLPRTGIVYTDLVSLVSTAYVNPNMPKGKALATMLKIKFSYRFLSYLVDKKRHDKRRRYATLIKFLSFAQPLIPLIEWAKVRLDPCADSNDDSGGCGCHGHAAKHDDRCCCCCNGHDEWSNWVYTWFERIGCITVLESGEGPQPPKTGRLWAEPQRFLA
ncbi:hypothetical protein EPUS_09217 [Endocarpon pusillum Z07020]|uniref:Uncharacterized protein n=1 Tax=Endocarpon pusillum (strain Z07020 / HMAS-L-300199) TaxID=1263415 RepID=U1HMM9_ENDPU|nr:uncharacterized protein EPUS_09217 [Endocarpon pusillum Z07020]ERF70274.1 hypothetical protein EPUS_09217 [Endocarpon pusillum Z07020]